MLPLQTISDVENLLTGTLHSVQERSLIINDRPSATNTFQSHSLTLRYVVYRELARGDSPFHSLGWQETIWFVRWLH